MDNASRSCSERTREPNCVNGWPSGCMSCYVCHNMHWHDLYEAPPRPASTVGGEVGWLAERKGCRQAGDSWQGRGPWGRKAGAVPGGMCLASCHCIACYAIHTIHTATWCTIRGGVQFFLLLATKPCRTKGRQNLKLHLVLFFGSFCNILAHYKTRKLFFINNNDGAIMDYWTNNNNKVAPLRGCMGPVNKA